MPEVVSQVEALERAASSNGSSNNGARAPRLKTWAASPKLFPCEVTAEGKRLVEEVDFLHMQLASTFPPFT